MMSDQTTEVASPAEAEGVLADAMILALLTGVAHASAWHVFSIADIIGGFDGATVADDPSIIDLAGVGAIPTITDKEGEVLYPIDSEFGFEVEDFYEAVEKARDGVFAEGWAGDVTVMVDGQVLSGISLVNAKTATFKSGQPLGTWAAGLGGNSVKASTEHYDVMASLLSDQDFAGDPGAAYALDDDLRIVDYDRDPGGLTPGVLHDLYARGIIEALERAIANVGNPDQTFTDIDFDRDGAPDQYTILTVAVTADPDGDGVPQSVDVGGVDLSGDGVADVVDSHLNGFGTADLADILQPNESSVYQDIAVGDDYSVTLKDDGKLLYRWGTEIKRPNDIRMAVELDLPDEWTDGTDGDDNGTPDAEELNGGLGYRVTRAELVILHTVTNNPNDQVRPEDWENEGATGRLPSYHVVQDPADSGNTLWVSPVDSYDGAGNFLPSYFRLDANGEIDLGAGGVAVRDPDGTLVGYRNTDADGTLVGTVLRDLSLVALNDAADLPFATEDLTEGFTNAWYTSTDRDPFQWSYDTEAANPYAQVFAGFDSREAAEQAGFGDDDLASGPRWRLKANKFGQDIPGVEIPLIDNSEPPFQSDNIRYEVGELTTTTLNLLDWADVNGNGLADDSPLRFSSGWTLVDRARLDLDGDGVIDGGWSAVNGSLGAGDAVPDGPVFSAVSPNGMELGEDFLDVAFYLKGDRQGNARIFSTQLVLEYESPDAPVTTLALGEGAGQPLLSEAGKGLAASYNGSLAAAKEDEPGAVDVDEPLNQAPDFVSTHVFGTGDVTGRFDGTRVADLAPGDTPIIDFTAAPIVTKEGVELYPINSEFAFHVTDFDGATERDFFLDPDHVEGWAGDILGPLGEQEGIVVSNAETDTFLTPARMGTWLVGMGGDSVKASTEHYGVMQAILSDQYFPEDPDAEYILDDDLILVGGPWAGQSVEDALALVGDLNDDGVTDIRDVLQPNENTITENIAVSSDYSVTLKDDGKLLYRWGNMIKRPVDIRLGAEMDLPSEWGSRTDPDSGLPALFRVSQAELVVRQDITNNPNDQIRPEDFENEAAIGRLPGYVETGPGEWESVADYYAGDGTFYPDGTALRDPAIPAGTDGTLLDRIGATSPDLDDGFTNAWYTTMDREPFEAVTINGEYVVGPRWRLKDNKYGQDLPGVEIPLDPSLPPPPTKNEVKYEVGAETQTVLNLLDWEGVSPLTLSAGWQDAPGTVTENGLGMSPGFDVAFYVKGDRKPATIHDATLVMDYEAVEIHDAGVTIAGTAGDDVLVGQGDNVMGGGAGDDLFVVAYGAGSSAAIEASRITDFGDGLDSVGLINLGVTEGNFDARVSQSVVNGTDLSISLDGTELVILSGVTGEVPLARFYLANFDVLPSPTETAGDRDDDGTADLLWRLDDGTVRGLLTGTGVEGDIAWADGDWRVVDIADHSGDGRPDLLWRNDANGGTWLSELVGNAVADQGGWGVVDSGWHIVATPDLDGDGRSDILWRYDDGSLYGWRVDGATLVEGRFLGAIGTEWHVEGTPDLDGDGRDDILWRHDDGARYGWLMDGLAIADSGAGQGVLADPAEPGWDVAATPDLDGDGDADLLWQNADGTVYAQLLDGVTTVGGADLGLVAGWSVAGAPDLDGDGDDDLVWIDDGSSIVYGWLMDGAAIASQGVLASGPAVDVVDFLDTDGDGREDVQIRLAATGEVVSLETDGLAVLQSPVLTTLPETAEYLGEGVGLWDDAALI